MSTKVKNYGINSALIEVYVNLKIQEKIILPFYNENIEMKTKVPVALKIVTGTVPKYYGSGITQNTPSVVIPTEENIELLLIIMYNSYRGDSYETSKN